MQKIKDASGAYVVCFSYLCYKYLRQTVVIAFSFMFVFLVLI